MNRDGVLMQAVALGYSFGSRTIITATGSSTYTTPTNCRAIFVEAIGSGGGGRTTGNSTAGQIIIGGGGGGGSYAFSQLIVTASGTTFFVSVGAGGAANGAGNASRFHSAPSVNAGYLWVWADAGPVGSAAIATGTSELFDVSSAGATSGGGAGALVFSGNGSILGHRVSGTVAINGRGAPGPRGGCPLGNNAQIATAVAGGKYGAGGSGGISINAGGASTGGAGGQGVIIVWEFY